ncbi:MAG: ABC transporter ATP-binding protein/permease [Maledivibacter sp.]|jgi:ATP-binding cassette subfamily B protein|nr:ABC transporter ATP-binding protein/permease [Maledivibacter sp.]
MFRTVKRIIDWCGEFKGRLYIGFVFSFFSTWFAAMPILVAAYTLGMLIEDVNGKNSFNKEWIWLSFVIIAILIFLRFIFDYFRARYQESISYELAARDRLAVGNILKRVSLGYFHKNSVGDIVNAVTTGLDTLEMMGIRMINTFISGYLNALCIFIFLAFYNPLVSLIAIIGVALSAVFLKQISNKSRKNADVLEKANKDLSNSAIEYARGLSIVKSFGQEGISIEAMKNACTESKDINIKIEKSFTPSNCLHMVMLKLASVGLVASTSYLTFVGQMEFHTMLVFCMFSFSIFQGIEPISDSAHVLSVIDVAMDQMDKLKNEEYIDDKGRELNPENYNIVFKNVSFSYDKREVIDNVSFTIPQNKTTAIVGPSGSGKTTLCNLIAKFYDFDSGSITVGGYDIREYTCDSLLKNISMVFQSVYLFNDTIINNIRFGRPDASDEEVYEAAKKACCHEFICELPNGYNTMIGEGGSSLSGGEKQRISIARAMLKDAPIIILDEATASVDPENEHLIQSAISELTHGKTIITIAHRLATIRNADQILVVNEGKIAESGMHEDLIQKEGIYKKFVEIRKKAEGWNM